MLHCCAVLFIFAFSFFFLDIFFAAIFVVFYLWNKLLNVISTIVALKFKIRMRNVYIAHTDFVAEEEELFAQAFCCSPTVKQALSSPSLAQRLSVWVSWRESIFGDRASSEGRKEGMNEWGSSMCVHVCVSDAS